EGRRCGPGLHRFRVFAARLAQGRGAVDEAGQGDQAVGIEGFGAGVIQVRPDGRDRPAVEQDAGGLLAVAGDDDPAEQPAVVVRHRATPVAGNSVPPSSRYRTAIRVVTPLATCSTIVERTESAPSAAISTPRFIGPGCMTMACPGSRAIRAVSSPYRRLYSRTLGK